MNARVRWLPLLLATLASVPALPACASGVWTPEAVFVTVDTPEPGRLASFLGGDIGIVRRDYALLYLWAAQRALRGQPLSAGEIAVARAAQLDLGADSDGLSLWRAGREAFSASTGAPPGPEIEVFGTLSDGEVDASFLNCQDDAFRTATKQLAAHLRRPADAQVWVRDWVLGQDAVFSNCAIEGGSDPLPAPADAPTWLQRDRAYQQAAAHFYRGNTAAAASAFAAIAADRESPWAATAGYLVARTWLRQALHFSADQADREAALTRAMDAVRAGLGELPRHGQRSQREAFGRLQRRIMVLRDPQAAFLAAVERLEVGASGEDFMLDLEEVRFLRDDVPPEVGQRSWLLTMQAEPSSQAFEFALTRWRETRTADWLLAALLHAPATGTATDDLLAAADALPADAPGALAIGYERARLLAARGDARAAAAAEALAARPGLSISDRNAIASLRFMLAADVDTAMTFAAGPMVGIAFEGERDLWQGQPRTPTADAHTPVAVKATQPGADPDDVADVDHDWMDESWPLLAALKDQHTLLPDPAAVLDFWLPADRLLQAATSAAPGLSAYSRRQMVGVAWLRAWLLRQPSTFRAATAAMRDAFPEQRALFDAGVDVLPGATGGTSAGAFRAAVIVLRLPGLPLHVHAGVGRALAPDAIGLLSIWRWWGDGADEFGADVELDRPAFLTDDMAARALAERRQLRQVADVTRLLGPLVLRHAEAFPRDPLVPEALHLVVRATRFGTADTALSRRAHALLHRRYAGSEWAKRTPYFF